MEKFICDKEVPVPKVGDIIYVPSIEATTACNGRGAWDTFKKKGGYATVGMVQKSQDNKHFVFVTEYGGYDMAWEEFLKPQQEELAKEYGIQTRAQTLLR